MPRFREKPFRRERFLRGIRQRIFVRLHMALILAGTALSGLLASKALLETGVGSMAVRYPLAVLLSYLAFFLFVKIWLWYAAAATGDRANAALNATDALDTVHIPDGPGTVVEKAIRFGGGQAGGGGAGGSFDVVADAAGGARSAVADAAGTLADAAGKTAAEGGETVGEAAGEAAAGAFDADELALPLLLLAALLAAVLGAGLYLVWQAPSILPEAAFDAALAASLLRGARRIEAPDWTAGVFRGTWKPFLWVVAVTLVFALVVGHHFPHARKIADLFAAAQ